MGLKKQQTITYFRRAGNNLKHCHIWARRKTWLNDFLSKKFLPYESNSIGHHSVGSVFIFSDVVNEGQDKLNTRLYQHYISWRRKHTVLT